MTPEKLSKMTLQELAKQEKALKVATPILAGLLAVMFVLSILLFVRQGFSAFSTMPIAFLPLLIVNIMNLKKVRKEIISRKI
ncbi:MAG: hypothetical protein MUC49_07390 [Raineya sp.]|jgi:hypothetical protein|nr:hypothetical protein [Raineya sp.]